MYRNFKAVSLSHKSASVEIRERVALNEEECRRLLSYFKEFMDFQDVLVLSTCNRTEVYYSSSTERSSEIVKLIGLQKSLDSKVDYSPYFQNITKHDEAVKHLFRVSVGLESQVVGDMQITHQVKKAYQWSVDADLAGPFLHRLLHSAFFTNKKIVQETTFRDGAASVSFAATETVVSFAEENKDARILLCGLGEIGKDVTKNIASHIQKGVYITNRTFSKAKAMAEACGFEAIPFEQALKEVHAYDIIVSSVNFGKHLITKEHLNGASIFTHKVFVDLSMPRSIAPDIEEVPGVLLYNIDEIRNKTTEALERRMAAIPSAEAIVDESIADFKNWSKEMIVSPTIQKLKNALEEIRQEEIARYLKVLNPTESKKVDKITKGIMQKVIKLPVLQLKAACQRGDAENLIDLLNDLFDLEKSTKKVKK